VLKGALAAAVTPLRDEGHAVDLDAIAPYVDFLAAGGLDGVFVLGTTGEGVLLSAEERRLVAEAFVRTADGRLQVAVHCGAQTGPETFELAQHAVEIGADAVAVIPPPYYELDVAALREHLLTAARGAQPLPFYLYEFKARSGYAIPVDLVLELARDVPHLAGLKVSDRPWEAVAPYIETGLPVFVGAEDLVARGLSAGAAGAVSGLAAAFPEQVATAVRTGSDEASEQLGELRRGIERFPFHAALKHVLVRKGVLPSEDVRRPLRPLEPDERDELDRWLESS
jgi:dihydrodipicolinate synthase/N-acetylneuraminate lyase